MTDRINPGYIDPVQKHDLEPEVPGAGTSGQENLAKRPCEELDPTESKMNAHADGDNPTYTLPPFADGKDLRNRG